jgi:23S rRNA (uracil1939-C5)-methyltransferase
MAEIIKNLDITALVHGGRGIGRHEGQAVFVPMTAPGDRVACRVVRRKRRFIEAELCAVLVPSPLRREPPCPYFGDCGGCQWQHLPYREQLRWKEQLFQELMLRNKVMPADRLKPIMAARDEWCYRSRVQLKCHDTAARLVVGFYRHGSHFVVDVDTCRIVSPHIQRALQLLRAELQAAPCRGSIPQVDVACGDDGAVRIILHVLPEGVRQLRPWLQDFARRHDFNACLQSGRKDTLEVVQGTGDLTVTVDQPGMPLRYGPGGFVQVNSAQNRNMVAAMLALLELRGTENVLDLFCGMGNFSLPVARRAGRVVGVEDYPPSIASARGNAEANALDNVEFHAADAAGIISGTRGNVPNLVILDPPRTGNYQAARQLLTIRPERILYVSCDPATLARDLVPLVNDDYQVLASQPFDFFPQTWHIESMTLLTRIDPQSGSEKTLE